jgi:hypothetical protein
MNSRAKKLHSKKQQTTALKPTPKKKKVRLKMVTYKILVRKNRESKKVAIKDTITHFNQDLARQLAASKHPNNWISLQPIRGRA